MNKVGADTVAAVQRALVVAHRLHPDLRPARPPR